MGIDIKLYQISDSIDYNFQIWILANLPTIYFYIKKRVISERL